MKSIHVSSQNLSTFGQKISFAASKRSPPRGAHFGHLEATWLGLTWSCS